MANQMLDAIGLTQRDGDGFRMHKDGSGTVEMQITVGTEPEPRRLTGSRDTQGRVGERRN